MWCGTSCHLSFAHLSNCLKISANPDCLGIQRNLTGYLDFTRRFQRCNPFYHPRSRKIPTFLQNISVNYRFAPFFLKNLNLNFHGFYTLPPLKEFRLEINTHIQRIKHMHMRQPFKTLMTKNNAPSPSNKKG